MIKSADLIEQAEFLARREQRKPKEASLRRAVSAAYYALFHELSRTAADAFVGGSKDWSLYSPTYRIIEHGAAKKFFESIRNRASEFGPLGPTVIRVGEAFILLQDERKRADYVPDPYPRSRAEVLDFIAQAKDRLFILSNLPKDTKLTLAVGLLAASKRKQP